MTGIYDNELEAPLRAAVVAMRNQRVPADPMQIALAKAMAINRTSRPRRTFSMWPWVVSAAVAAALALLVWSQWPEAHEQQVADVGPMADPVANQTKPSVEKPVVKPTPLENVKDGSTPNAFGGQSSPPRGLDGLTQAPKKGRTFAGARVGRRVVAVPSAKLVVCTGSKEPLDLGQAAKEGDIRSWHIQIWDLAKGGKSRTLKAEVPEGFAVSPDGKWLVTTKGRKIDLDADQESKLEGMADVTRVCFSPDGKMLLALAGPQADGTMRVFDWPAMKLRVQLPEQFGYMFAWGFTADSRRVALVDKNRHIRVWDLDKGAVLATTEKGHSNSVRSLALSPDGKKLVSSGPGNEVWLWDATTGKHLADLPGQQQFGLPAEMECLVFSADGKRIAGGGPQNLAVWDADGQPIERFASASGGTVAAWFSADGNEVVAVSGFHGSGESDVYPSVRTWTLKKKE
jgi:Tol biopolymer transport system component